MADREEQTDSDGEPLMTRAVRVGGTGDDSDEEIEVVEEGEVEVCEDDTQGPKRTPLEGDKEKPEWTKGPHVVAEVEALMTKRGLPHYLVRWEGLPAEASTWEAGVCFKGRGETALSVFLLKKVCTRILLTASAAVAAVNSACCACAIICLRACNDLLAVRVF